MIGGLVGGVICGLEDKRTLPSDADKSLRTAHNCAAEGALVGGAIGLVWPVVGGVGGAVDDIARTGIGSVDEIAIAGIGSVDDMARTGRGVVDDIARSGIGGVDDVTRSGIGAVDDLANPAINTFDDAARPATLGVRRTAKLLTRDITAPLKREANVSRASFYKSLPKQKGSAGYVYVMDDAADGTIKIGMTKNPAQRISAIQSDIRIKVNDVHRKLRYVCIIRTDHMRVLERALHTAFTGQRLPNTVKGTEWFNLSAAQVTAACSL